MRFSKPKQIVAMTLVWASALIAYDQLFSKHLFAPTPEVIAKFTKPQMSMWVDHVGCSGGFEHVLRAVETLPWLGQIEVVGEADRTQAPESCGIGVIVDVRDVATADFMGLVSALRKFGIAPAAIQFGGIPHFALEAEVSDLIRCPDCVQAARLAMTPKKDLKVGGTFRWLDSARVSAEERTVTAYARFGYVADVGEMMRALEQAGFPPVAIRIEVGERA